MSTISSAGTPRARISGTDRCSRGAFRTATASPVPAARRPRMSRAGSAGGRNRNPSAAAATKAASRGVGVIPGSWWRRAARNGRSPPGNTGGRSPGDGDGGEGGGDGVVGAVALQLRLGPQDEPMAEDGRGHGGHVVGGDEGPTPEAGRGPGRRQQVHGGPGAGAEGDAGQVPGAADHRHDVGRDLVGDGGG